MKFVLGLALVLAMTSLSSCGKYGKGPNAEPSPAPAPQPPTPELPAPPPAPEKTSVTSWDLGIALSYMNNCRLDVNESKPATQARITCPQDRILFDAQRVSEIAGEKLGKLTSEKLLEILQRTYPGTWTKQKMRADVEGFETIITKDTGQTRQLFFVDETSGALKVEFHTPVSGDEEERRHIELLQESLRMDLRAPQIVALEASTNVVNTQEDWTIEVKVTDDLTGIDIESVQEWDENSLWNRVALPERPTDLRGWFGYNVSHRLDKYSPAYAIPIMSDTTSVWSSEEGFIISTTVPKHAPRLELVLGGISFADEFGHEVKITLDPAQSEGETSYLAKYRYIKGSGPELKKLAAKIRPSETNETVDKQAPNLLEGGNSILNGFNLHISDLSLVHVLRAEYLVDGKSHEAVSPHGVNLSNPSDYFWLYPAINLESTATISLKRLVLMDTHGNVNDITNFDDYPALKEGFVYEP